MTITTEQAMEMAKAVHAKMLAEGHGMNLWHSDAIVGDIQHFLTAMLNDNEQQVIQRPTVASGVMPKEYCEGQLNYCDPDEVREAFAAKVFMSDALVGELKARVEQLDKQHREAEGKLYETRRKLMLSEARVEQLQRALQKCALFNLQPATVQNIVNAALKGQQ